MMCQWDVVVGRCAERPDRAAAVVCVSTWHSLSCESLESAATLCCGAEGAALAGLSSFEVDGWPDFVPSCCCRSGFAQHGE